MKTTMQNYTGQPHWTDIKTKLKMSAMGRAVMAEIEAAAIKPAGGGK
jgi:hypothetical protein